MSRRKRRTSHSNHERWLISYADFITLLFAFFVVLYASSQVDNRKVGKLALAIQVAFQEMGVFQSSGAEIPLAATDPAAFSKAQAIENVGRSASIVSVVPHPKDALDAAQENGDLAKLQTELETTLSGEIKRKEIAMRREPDGLVISLREVGFFESGSAQMKSASQGALDRIAGMLRQRDYRVRIEGHTDNAPIHTAQFPSNWELSTARATEIVRLLIVKDGFSPDRLSAAGYAEYHPVAVNRTAEGRGMNRRVDIVVLGHVLAPAPLAEVGGDVLNKAAKPSPVAKVAATAAKIPADSPSP